MPRYRYKLIGMQSARIFVLPKCETEWGSAPHSTFFCTVPLKEKIKSRRRSAKCRFRSHAHQLFHLHKGADIFQEGGSAQKRATALVSCGVTSQATLAAPRICSPCREWIIAGGSDKKHKILIFLRFFRPPRRAIHTSTSSSPAARVWNFRAKKALGKTYMVFIYIYTYINKRDEDARTHAEKQSTRITDLICGVGAVINSSRLKIFHADYVCACASAGEKYFAAITSSPAQRSVRRRLPDQLAAIAMRFINLSKEQANQWCVCCGKLKIIVQIHNFLSLFEARFEFIMRIRPTLTKKASQRHIYLIPRFVFGVDLFSYSAGVFSTTSLTACIYFYRLKVVLNFSSMRTLHCIRLLYRSAQIYAIKHHALN